MVLLVIVVYGINGCDNGGDNGETMAKSNTPSDAKNLDIVLMVNDGGGGGGGGVGKGKLRLTEEKSHQCYLLLPELVWMSTDC